MVMQTGELRKQLREEWKYNIERAINASDKGSMMAVTADYGIYDHITLFRDQRKKKTQKYWLLTNDRWVGNTIHTVIIFLDKQPPRLLNTILLEVDERKGKCVPWHVLPKDIPLDGVDLEEGDGLVADSGKDLPIAG